MARPPQVLLHPHGSQSTWTWKEFFRRHRRERSEELSGQRPEGVSGLVRARAPGVGEEQAELSGAVTALGS